MKIFIQFYNRNLNGQLVEALGSDSVLNLDNRYNLDSHIDQARNRAKRLKKLKPNYEAFKIMKGENYSNSRPITGLITL